MLKASRIVLERHFEPVFSPVDLEIGPGELCLLTGPNGCGKTTLIRLLAGIVRPSEGVVVCSARQMAYLGHQIGLKEDLSVVENLRFFQQLYGASNDQLQRSLHQIGLDSARHQTIRTLSAGQRKRCALARLLMDQAELWLLDEPYANLDREGISLVDQLIADHLEGGGACILSTHGALRPATLPFHELVLEPGRLTS